MVNYKQTTVEDLAGSFHLYGIQTVVGGRFYKRKNMPLVAVGIEISSAGKRACIESYKLDCSICSTNSPNRCVMYIHTYI